MCKHIFLGKIIVIGSGDIPEALLVNGEPVERFTEPDAFANFFESKVIMSVAGWGVLML